MGEIIWQKGKGASGSCAWGSWRSAKSPRLRDLHEYLIVFTKRDFPDPIKANRICLPKNSWNLRYRFGKFNRHLQKRLVILLHFLLN